ncbi:MAG: hypothetical protein JSU72_14275 [Deltaproteobacteria bacterium]|nr:MAG: hypothetical protein JSU72_14275 [Deltaproteobacteria bacterium]
MRKCIPLKDAEVEMILAKDVKNDKGMILCSEGTPLTEELIDRFQQMEIASIYIESNKEMSPEEYLASRQKIEKRFAASSDQNSLLGKLKTVLLERLESPKGSHNDGE